VTVYAIVRDRGAQYRVEEGQFLDVALLDLEAGAEVELGEVLMIGGDEPRIGAPLVEGARVRAEVVGEARGEKIVVFKYRNKKRYRRRTGHRQDYTRLAIREIVA
jgi:large subunit ribosomal protein L21